MKIVFPLALLQCSNVCYGTDEKDTTSNYSVRFIYMEIYLLRHDPLCITFLLILQDNGVFQYLLTHSGVFFFGWLAFFPEKYTNAFLISGFLFGFSTFIMKHYLLRNETN